MNMPPTEKTWEQSLDNLLNNSGADIGGSAYEDLKSFIAKELAAARAEERVKAVRAMDRLEEAAREEGRNEAVDHIIRIAWEGAAPDTKLVNKSILEEARRSNK